MTCTLEIEVSDDFTTGDCSDCPFNEVEYQDYDDDGYMETDMLEHCGLGYGYSEDCPLEEKEQYCNEIC